MNLINKLKTSFLLISFTALTTSILLLLPSIKSEAQDRGEPNCSIIFSEGGNPYAINPVELTGGTYLRAFFSSLEQAVFPSGEGAFSFIRLSDGPCVFVLSNEEEYGGRLAVYGAVNDRVRIGSEGADDGGGWRARSLRVFAVSDDCYIDLGDGGVTQRFYGPGEGSLLDGYAYITGWDFVRETGGSCTFEVFNGSELDGRSEQFSSGISENIRVGWRIRSIRIKYE